MTDQQPSPLPGSDQPDQAPGTTIEPGQLVSIRDAPEDWVEAAAAAPAADTPGRASRRDKRRSTLPIRREGSFVANAVAAAAAFVTASIWYGVDVLDLYEGPWTPVVVAAVIAATIRLFSKANPTHRAVVAVLAYLLVLLIVLMLLTHRDLVGLYGAIDDYRAYEQSLVRSRLQDPFHLVAYGIGGIVAALIPLAGERR